MLRSLITATAGDMLARRLGGASAGRAGALIGFALPFIARRAGPAGMIGAAVGAWAVGKLLQSEAAKRDTNATPESPAGAGGTGENAS
ncbi:MAG: hypothetical protein RL490_1434 [Pseudomonadota bacterium]|jgi:uncharacterized protein YqgC (DUF456 family)